MRAKTLTADHCENVHCYRDPESNLTAIVALHSTALGPAIGGCRYLSYDSFDEAMLDAKRLSQAMSLKAAIHKLPHGGGKTVIMKPKEGHDKTKALSAFAKHLNKLNGCYITAVDSGTTDEDMNFMAQKTPFVLSEARYLQPCKPAFYTALGVLRAIEAALKHTRGSASVEGMHIAIQGMGNVGMILASFLTERGAKLSVSDIDAAKCQTAKTRFGADIVDNATIHALPCDVFSPCALGGIIHDGTVHQIQANIVAGAANNVCQNPTHHAQILFKKNIVLVPDYVANGGGLIHAAQLYAKMPESKARAGVDAIYDTTLEILSKAKTKHCCPQTVADQLALARLELANES